MTLQSIGLPILWPGMATRFNNAPALGNDAIHEAAGEEYKAYIHCASEDMTVSHVGLRVQSATGSPTIDVRIETVDTATGLPTGTLWGTNTNLVTSTISTGWALHALTASASITKGQIFAVKTVCKTGTSFIPAICTAGGAITGLPYGVSTSTGSAVKAGMGDTGAAWVLGSSSTTFYKLLNFLPISSIAQNSFNNTSSARRGVRFQVPFACQCVGIRYYAGSVVGDFNYAMFSDAGSELNNSSTAFEGDVHSAAVTSGLSLYFDNPVTLTAATWYRAAIEPSSSTNCNMYVATAPSADYLTGFPGGPNFHYTTYVASSWTDSATDQVPFMDLILKQLDDGVNAAGSHVIGG